MNKKFVYQVGNNKKKVIVKESGCGPGPVWTCVEYLDPTGIRSPNRPFGSKLLYWLRYAGPLSVMIWTTKWIISLKHVAGLE